MVTCAIYVFKLVPILILGHNENIKTYLLWSNPMLNNLPLPTNPPPPSPPTHTHLTRPQPLTNVQMSIMVKCIYFQYWCYFKIEWKMSRILAIKMSILSHYRIAKQFAYTSWFPPPPDFSEIAHISIPAPGIIIMKIQSKSESRNAIQ